MVKYASIPAEGLIFRENFINNAYVSDNGGVASTGSVSADNGQVFADDLVIDYVNPTLNRVLKTGVWSIRVGNTMANVGTDGGAILGWYVDVNNRFYLEFPRNGNSSWRTVAAVNGGGANSATGVVLSNGYHELVLTVNGLTWIAYLDGKPTTWSGVGVQDLTGMVGDSPGIYIGGTASATAAGNGTIPFVEMYDRVLTAKEALDLYQEDTFREVNANKSEVWLQLKSHYDDGGNEVTTNKGVLDSATMFWGDGSTPSTFPTLLPNNGISLDGGDYIQINDTDSLDITATTDITFFFWARLDALTGNRAFFGKTDGSFANDTGYMLGLLSDNDLSFVCNDGGVGEQIITVNNILNDIGWHSYAVVVDRTDTNKVYIYMDGVLQNVGGTIITVTGGWEKATNFVLGGLNSTMWQINGAMKYPIVNKRVLTPTQINWLHDRTLKEWSL